MNILEKYESIFFANQLIVGKKPSVLHMSQFMVLIIMITCRGVSLSGESLLVRPPRQIHPGQRLMQTITITGPQNGNYKSVAQSDMFYCTRPKVLINLISCLPLLMTSGGHHWRPVQTCSLQDPPPTHTLMLTSGGY